MKYTLATMKAYRNTDERHQVFIILELDRGNSCFTEEHSTHRKMKLKNLETCQESNSNKPLHRLLMLMITLPQYILYMYTAHPRGFQVTPMCLREPTKLTSGKRSRTEPANGGEEERLDTEIENRRQKYVKTEKSRYYLKGRYYNQP
jgi:hypothetical protein